MLLVQILIVAFALFALSRAFGRFRHGELPAAWFAMWAVVWAAVIVAAVLPQVTSWFAALIGVGRGADAAIYLAIIFLFYAVFRVFVRLERIEHDITLVVRRIGLEEADRDRKDGGRR